MDWQSAGGMLLSHGISPRGSKPFILACESKRAFRPEARMDRAQILDDFLDLLRVKPPAGSPQHRQFQPVRCTNMTMGYLEAESLANSAIASWTVVMNCAGKMMVEFFSTEISAIVWSVRS